MSARRRAEPVPSPVRGAVLVVVALLIGFVLIRSGIDAGTASSSGKGDTKTTTGDGGTTSTTKALRPAAQVKVVVANGSGVSGAAGKVTTTLQGKGYQVGSATNATRVAKTVVYYVPGYEREAQAVAVALSVAPAMVAPMPSPAPVTDLQNAQIVIVLGPDLAK
jgi:hypothetical protein